MVPAVNRQLRKFSLKRAGLHLTCLPRSRYTLYRAGCLLFPFPRKCQSISRSFPVIVSPFSPFPVIVSPFSCPRLLTLCFRCSPLFVTRLFLLSPLHLYGISPYSHCLYRLAPFCFLTRFHSGARPLSPFLLFSLLPVVIVCLPHGLYVLVVFVKALLFVCGIPHFGLCCSILSSFLRRLAPYFR